MADTSLAIGNTGTNYFGVTVNPKKKELDMQAFLTLLVAQLEHQNPLEPMGDRDFFAQMAQLGQVQGMEDLQKSMDIAQASSLMGREVTAFRPMTENANAVNEMVTGKVEKLSTRNGEFILTLRQDDGGLVDVKMKDIREVSA